MPLLEWYRPLPARRMGHVAAWGICSLILGTVMVGLAAYHRNVGASWRPALGLLGGALTLGGPIILLAGFHRLLFRDNWFLALRTDGVAVRLPGLEVTIPWDELERAHTGEGGRLELRTRGGEVYRVEERFAGQEPAEIARKIDATRRRVLHHLPITGGTS